MSADEPAATEPDGETRSEVVSNTVGGAVGGHTLQIGSARDIHVSGGPVAPPSPSVWARVAVGAVAGLLVVGATVVVYTLGRGADPVSAGPGGVSPRATEPADTPAPSYGEFTAGRTEYCVEAWDEDVGLSLCDGRPGQQWAWVPGPNPSTYKVVNQGTGTCLGVEESDIVHRPCGASAGNQIWERRLFSDHGAGKEWFVSIPTGCLTLLTGSRRPAGPAPQALVLDGCDITRSDQLFSTMK